MARRVIKRGGTLVLDAEGLSKFATGDPHVGALVKSADARDARVILSAVTITEVLRHPSRDANLNRVLKKITAVEVDEQIARAAGELLGRTETQGTPGNPTVDALVAATAINAEGPALVLTSDPGDLIRLLDGTKVRVERV